MKHTNESQSAKILAHIKEHGKITPLEAYRTHRCMRLGARIYELKKRGHKIKTEMFTTKSKKRIAVYSFKDSINLDKKPSDQNQRPTTKESQ